MAEILTTKADELHASLIMRILISPPVRKAFNSYLQMFKTLVEYFHESFLALVFWLSAKTLSLSIVAFAEPNESKSGIFFAFLN